ncbi:hypothetical protein F5884DRAFT_776987 [Xylogone sp. PMI_703]|nr:hypothetical protein F5884DRAFT_776987 [Xylogone sp. PMI_703]
MDESNDLRSLRLSTSIFPLFLTIFMVYYLIERNVIRYLSQNYPTIYDRLKKREQLAGYVAFIMGMLVTLLSTPACTVAWLGSMNTNDKPGSPFYSTAGNICIASKSLLWTAELNRLNFATVYVLHHVFSLMSLLHHLYFDIQLGPLYAIYASLVTELLSDFIAILGYHRLNFATSRLAYVTELSNFVALMFIRISAAVYAATTIRDFSSKSIVFWTNAFSISFYIWVLLSRIWTKSRILMIVQVIENKVVVAQRFTITLYGIFFSLSSLLTAAAALIITLNDPSSTLSPLAVSLVARTAFYTAIISLIGSRIPGTIYYHGPLALLSSRLITAHSGFSLQGAMLAGALFICFPKKGITFDQRLDILSSVAVASLLGEAVGRIGCHFGACCGSSYERKSQDKGQLVKQSDKRSIPLYVTMITIPCWVAILVLYTSGTLSLRVTGALALGTQSLVRIHASQYRNDVALYMQVLAYAQLLLSAAMLIKSSNYKMPPHHGEYPKSDYYFAVQTLASEPWIWGLTVILIISGTVTKYGT